MRVGSIAYACRQGIGWLPKWFYDNQVINEVLIFRHGSRKTETSWYPEGTFELVGRPFNGPVVAEFLRKIDVLLQFETAFDDSFIDLCRKCGVKTVLVPMYECYPKQPKCHYDKYICPSLLDCEYFPNSPFLQIPCPPVKWEQRTIAKRFLHSGGNLGLRNHKGTDSLLEAMRYVESDIDLTIRAQDKNGLSRMLSRCPWIKKDKRVTIDVNEYPWEDLYTGFDVLIAPERYNGLSLPLMEGRGSGMLVVTSNRFPHDTWLPTDYLIEVESYSTQRVGPSYNDYQEAYINPKAIAKKLDELNGIDITQYSLDGLMWREDNSWANLKDKWIKELES